MTESQISAIGMVSGGETLEALLSGRIIVQGMEIVASRICHGVDCRNLRNGPSN